MRPQETLVRRYRSRWLSASVGLAIAVTVLSMVGVLAQNPAFQIEYQPSLLAPFNPIDGYDPYGRSDSILVGTRSEICVDSLPPGTAAFTAWATRWPGIGRADTLSCRLIAPPPGHSSRDIPPGDETWYDTWSAHAPGRAVDLFVGGQTAGDQLVDYLLAGRDGGPHVVARRLGVLQIIWDGACWEAREELSRLSIHSVADMRSQYPCPAGASHRDHVHVTLSFEGASAQTSGYPLLGQAPPQQLPPEFFVPGISHYGRR
ncbi:MAG: hypothetical protein ACR2HR_07530 [Euzebya sp.]